MRKRRGVKMKKIILSAILLFTTAILFATTIYDIQYTTNPGTNGWYPSPMVDQDVTVIGIVTGAYFSHGDNMFFISDPEGEPGMGFIFMIMKLVQL